MPTELLAGALASCFALALGHVARRDGRRAARPAGRRRRPSAPAASCATAAWSSAHAPTSRWSPTWRRARRLCWVSNTFAAPPEIEYRTEDAMTERLIVIGGGGAGHRARHHRQAPEPGAQGHALHRVPGHRLLAVRDPVRARPRDRQVRVAVPLDGRALRRGRARHADGDDGHRHRPRPRHGDLAQHPRGLRQARDLHGLDVGEARRARRQPRRAALRQGHPRGDGVRQGARRHEARRRLRRHADRRRDGRQPRAPRPGGRLRRRGPVGALGAARSRRRRARPRVADQARREAALRHARRGLPRRRTACAPSRPPTASSSATR